MRYRSSAVALAGNVRVYWDGAVEGMGVHVQMSGEGCRLIESQKGFAAWREWIGFWLDHGAKVARIDIAVDDESGDISFETVHEQVKSRTAVMRAQNFTLIESTSRKGTFQTLNVGRRSSQSFMRCYDKGMEQCQDKSWLRFEFEYKGDRAQGVARLLVDEGWDAAVGVARSVIEFKDPSHKTTDRTRQRPADWWVSLIDASKHVLRTSKDSHDSLVKAYCWLRRQAAPIIAVLVEHQGRDLSWVLDLAAEGRPKWNERHLRMLQSSGALPIAAGAH